MCIPMCVRTCHIHAYCAYLFVAERLAQAQVTTVVAGSDASGEGLCEGDLRDRVLCVASARRKGKPVARAHTRSKSGQAASELLADVLASSVGGGTRGREGVGATLAGSRVMQHQVGAGEAPLAQHQGGRGRGPVN